MFISILTVLIVSSGTSLFAQDEIILQGLIKEKDSENAIENAEITISSTKLATASDPWGNFIIEFPTGGEFEVVVKHIGYKTYRKYVSIIPGKSNFLEVSLELGSKLLEGVEITDINIREKYRLEYPVVQSIVMKDKLEETMISDLGTYIRSVPNVSSVRKGGTNLDPVVRGFKYAQLNVQMNHGLKIEGGCPNRMDPVMAHVEFEDVDHLRILKGPYALKYGPVLGGTIHIQTTKPVFPDKWKINGDAMLGYGNNPSSLRQHVGIQVGNKDIVLRVSGIYKDQGNYVAGNDQTMQSESTKYSFTQQLGYKVNKNNTFWITTTQSYGRDVLFPALPMDMRTDDSYLFSFDYIGHDIFNFFTTLDAKVYRSDVRHVMDNKNRSFSDTVVAVTSVDAVNQGFRVEGSLGQKGNKAKFGVDYENIYKDGQRVKTAITQPTMPVFVEQIWNNAIITNLGVFGEYRTSILFLDFILASRLDYNSASSDDVIIEKMNNIIYSNTDNESNFMNFSVSGGAKARMNERMSLELMLGRGVRSPDMVERYVTLLPVGYDRYDYLGNPKLKPESNFEVDITYHISIDKAGSFAVNGFYSLVSDFITGEIVPPSEQKPLSKDVNGVKRFYNADKAYFRGFEFTWASPTEHNFGSKVSAAYTRATINKVTRHTFNENGEVVGTQELQNDPLLEIPPLEGNVQVYYQFFEGKLVPKVNVRLVADQDFVSEAFYESTTPGFVIADITFLYRYNEHFRVTGGVENIFDKAYYEHLNRRIIGTGGNFYEPGRNFFINLMFNF